MKIRFLGLFLVALLLSGCSVEHISETQTTKLASRVRLAAPHKGEIITSPLKIYGQAPGNWFFEATAPVMVTDWNGKILNKNYVTAQGRWMTTGPVPFVGELTFTVPKDIPYRRGTLILQRNNPSGISQNDEAIEIPIIFGE